MTTHMLVNYLLRRSRTLQFSGIKLLEINANADVDHRIAILRDGISAKTSTIIIKSPEYLITRL
jgi:hypothetical protein